MVRLPNWLLLVLALALLMGLTSAARADEVKGKIQKVTADKNEFVVTDKDGKDLTFRMDENAKIRLNDQDKRLADLKKGDEVTVTYKRQGTQLVATQIRCERK